VAPTTQRTVPRERRREVDAHLHVVEARRVAEADLFRRLGDQKVQSGVGALDAIQSCLDEAWHELRFFQQEVEKLTPQQLAWQTPNRKLLTLVHQLRAEVTNVSGTIIKLGLDERVAKVKEAQIGAMVRALDQAMVAAGISVEQRTQIGRALKAIEATALEE
jgi:hypothetical protein